MALKYPFGACTTPVVAPTTVSATTELMEIVNTGRGEYLNKLEPHTR
jgi:hypothetical protein